MKAALVKVDITPQKSVRMAGYGRKEASEGVLDSIQINTLLLEANKQIFVYSYLDAIMIEESFVRKIREQVSEKLSIPYHHINVGCTHTHSAPAFFKLFFEEMTVETALQEEALEKMIQSIETAYDQRQSCVLYHDELKIEGLYGNRNRIDGPSDKTFSVLELRNEAGECFGACLNVAVHPTVLNGSNHMLSSDLLGWIRQRYEAQYHHPCLIFNGTAGDVSTRFYRDENPNETLKNVSGKIIGHIADMYLKPLKTEPVFYDHFIYTVHSDFANDPDNRRFIDNPQGPMGKMMKERALKKADWQAFDLDLEASMLVLGNLILISLPGDVVSAFGLKIRSCFPDQAVLISGYTNGYVNYLVNEAEYGKYFETVTSRSPRHAADKFIDLVIERIKQKMGLA